MNILERSVREIEGRLDSSVNGKLNKISWPDKFMSKFLWIMGNGKKKLRFFYFPDTECYLSQLRNKGFHYLPEDRVQEWQELNDSIALSKPVYFISYDYNDYRKAILATNSRDDAFKELSRALEVYFR